ncbi:MAG: hypothetical protein IKX56_05540 [Muribaculaceae bacterium]|nr:hypothetical protein [Muribaculaceae bacterium]
MCFTTFQPIPLASDERLYPVHLAALRASHYGDPVKQDINNPVIFRCRLVVPAGTHQRTAAVVAGGLTGAAVRFHHHI